MENNSKTAKRWEDLNSVSVHSSILSAGCGSLRPLGFQHSEQIKRFKYLYDHCRPIQITPSCSPFKQGQFPRRLEQRFIEFLIRPDISWARHFLNAKLRHLSRRRPGHLCHHANNKTPQSFFADKCVYLRGSAESEYSES